MQPLADRLLLKLPEAPTKLGRFWLPATVQQDFVVCQAEIVERGDGVRDVRLQPGARIICKRFGRFALPDGTFVIQEEQVLALLDVAAL